MCAVDICLTKKKNKTKLIVNGQASKEVAERVDVQKTITMKPIDDSTVRMMVVYKYREEVCTSSMFE